MGNAPELLSPAPEIGEIEIVASKVNVAGEGKTAGLANGLKVLIHAKPGQALVVREFLYVSHDSNLIEPWVGSNLIEMRICRMPCRL